MRFKGNETDDSALPKLLHGMALHIFRLRSRRQSKALSLPTILREMSVHILSLRSRRQHRAWGGASAEPQVYGVSTHQAREVGGSFLSCAISSSLRLGQWLSPASRACAINSDRTRGSATLHPRLYAAARIRGLRTRQNVGKDKALCRRLLRRLKTGCAAQEKMRVMASLIVGLTRPALLFFALLCLASPAKAQSGDRQLRWGGDAEGGAPYLLPNPKNPREIIGFEIDLMDAVGKQLNRKSAFVQNQWDGLIPGLQRGNYDLAVNGIEITDDRKQQVNFSIPYYACGEQLSVRAGENTISSLSDLKGKVVGTLKASLAQRILERANLERSNRI